MLKASRVSGESLTCVTTDYTLLVYCPFAQDHTVIMSHFIGPWNMLPSQPAMGRVTADSRRWFLWSKPPFRAPATNGLRHSFWSQQKNVRETCAPFSPCAQRAPGTGLRHMSARVPGSSKLLPFSFLKFLKSLGPRHRATVLAAQSC